MNKWIIVLLCLVVVGCSNPLDKCPEIIYFPSQKIIDEYIKEHNCNSIYWWQKGAR